jgi:trimethylamine:corrinoid methyltransferase-like protein
MRPTLRLLDDSLIEKIVAEALDLLCTLGVEIHNPSVVRMLSDHGAEVTEAKCHARLAPAIIDKALREEITFPGPGIALARRVL